MKVILRADIENLGHLGDVVEVKPGYGRNYLIPQDLAMLATPANLHAFELERKKLQARMDEIRTAASAIAEKLQDFVLTIAMRHSILLDGAIRTLGEHTVRARLHADVVPTFVVKVISEDKSHLGEEAPAE